MVEGGSQKLRELIGDAKEFVMSEVPTKRAILQCAIFIRDNIVSSGVHHSKVKTIDIAKELVKKIMEQWSKANAKFVPPVVVQVKSLQDRVSKLWEKAQQVLQG